MHEEIVGIIREVCGKDIDEDMSLFGDLQDVYKRQKLVNATQTG